jgi:hypothetical protein
MSALGSVDLTIAQGATYSQVFTYKTGTPAVAVNLAGHTARMHLRTSYTAPAASLELTTENGRIVLGGSAGTVTLALAASVTAALNAGRYVYDLELVNGEIVTRFIEGIVTVSPNVTR